MALFPNDSNNGSSKQPQKPQENLSLSPARTEAAKKQARKWFIILLTVGLVLGSVMAVGVVKLLNKLGLTEKPDRPLNIELPQQQQ